MTLEIWYKICCLVMIAFSVWYNWGKWKHQIKIRHGWQAFYESVFMFVVAAIMFSKGFWHWEIVTNFTWFWILRIALFDPAFNKACKHPFSYIGDLHDNPSPALQDKLIHWINDKTKTGTPTTSYWQYLFKAHIIVSLLVINFLITKYLIK